MKNIRQFQICSTRWRSTAHSSVIKESPVNVNVNVTNEIIAAKSYDEVPGPTPWPIIGNTWRMLPVIGIVKLNDWKMYLD
jgi:hypothetical protein